MDDFLALLPHGFIRSGKGFAARCPAHDDSRPSLSISAGDKGILLNCKRGCKTDDICSAMGIGMNDLFKESSSTERPIAKPTFGASKSFKTANDALQHIENKLGRHSARWVYEDENGEPIGIVCRWETKNGKEIRPITRNCSGWLLGAMPEPRPLYRLPFLLQEKRVFVCEGEKAVDAAVALGYCATTSPHGSGSAAKADWSPLAGKEIVILPDNDEAGEKYAQHVLSLCCELRPRVSVRIVHIPGLPRGGDIADLPREGFDHQRFLELIESTPPERRCGANVVALSEVERSPVDWLWPSRMAIGKLTIVAGDPGLGKSFLSLDIAARISRGDGWPDAKGLKYEAGSVILLSAEDDVEDTIAPRLDAMNADDSRIFAIQSIRGRDKEGDYERMVDLMRDLAAIEEAIDETDNCRAIVVDPLSAYLGKTDSHSNSDVRGVLGALAEMSQRRGVAIIGISHLRKGEGAAIYKTMGSLAFVAAARAVWAVSKDKEDPNRKLLTQIKNNLALDPGGLAYRVVDGRLEWEDGIIDMDADEALASDKSQPGRKKDREARIWLYDFLKHGQRKVSEIKEAAEIETDFSWRTFQRVREEKGWLSFMADGERYWKLDSILPPDSGDNSPRDT